MTMILAIDSANLYLTVRRKAPIGGATFETIGSDLVSLGGTMTRNVRGLRRRFDNLETLVLTDAEYAAIWQARVAGVSAGLRIHDDTLPNLLPRSFREMRSWRNGATALSTSLDLRATVPSGGGTATPSLAGDIAAMFPALPSTTWTWAFTVRPGTAQSFSHGIRWCTATGALATTSNSSTAVLPAGVDTRVTLTLPAPNNPSIAYGQPFITCTGAAALSGPVVMPGAGPDTGGPWMPVHLLSVGENHLSPVQRTMSLTLRAV